jgi:hypothetical protein
MPQLFWLHSIIFYAMKESDSLLYGHITELKLGRRLYSQGQVKDNVISVPN